MRTSLECLSCIVRQAVESSKLLISDEQKILEIMKKVFLQLAQSKLEAPPPDIVQPVHAIIRKELGHDDPYWEIKKRSTQHALELAQKAEPAIAEANDSFQLALAFAIAGNILDFGMKTEWDERGIAATFQQTFAQSKKFDKNTVRTLYHEIESADTVLVLGDNAGEAVFDRLFMRQFPGNGKIYYAVKGSPVINDVTQAEALESGIDKVAEIISNGTDIPGTSLPKCAPEFVELYHSADVVISKGQGNYETLNEEKRKIWFLFQVKCAVIANHYGHKLKDWLVLESEMKG